LWSLKTGVTRAAYLVFCAKTKKRDGGEEMNGVRRAIINMTITVLIMTNMLAYINVISTPDSGLTKWYVWVMNAILVVMLNWSED